jgi:hypothetical protein
MADLEGTEDDSLADVEEMDKLEKEDVYTSLTPADHMWLKKTAKRMGETKSGALRRLVYNARMRDAFDEERLI